MHVHDLFVIGFQIERGVEREGDPFQQPVAGDAGGRVPLLSRSRQHVAGGTENGPIDYAEIP